MLTKIHDYISTSNLPLYVMIFMFVAVLAITVILAVRDSKRKKNGSAPKDTKSIVFCCVGLVVIGAYIVMQFIV